MENKSILRKVITGVVAAGLVIYSICFKQSSKGTITSAQETAILKLFINKLSAI